MNDENGTLTRVILRTVFAGALLNSGGPSQQAQRRCFNVEKTLKNSKLTLKRR